jgi:hypothetical protein
MIWLNQTIGKTARLLAKRGRACSAQQDTTGCNLDGGLCDGNPVTKPAGLLDLCSLLLKTSLDAVRPVCRDAACRARGWILRSGGAESTPMRWWRLRRMGTSGLGLFALLLQLFLSFGHLHSRDLFVPRAPAAADAQAAISKSPSAPGQEQIPSGIPDDNCPICATMHLAASGLLPPPPSVVGPAEFAHLLHRAFIEEFELGVRRHTLFQTRAPPFA